MSDAIAHFRAFRATFNEGDEVDEESGLAAADLDAAIEALELAPKMVGIQYIDFGTEAGIENLRRASEEE